MVSDCFHFFFKKKLRLIINSNHLKPSQAIMTEEFSLLFGVFLDLPGKAVGPHIAPGNTWPQALQWCSGDHALWGSDSGLYVPPSPLSNLPSPRNGI